jgi:hypothetical protein
MPGWIWLLVAYIIGSYFPFTKLLSSVKSKA